MNSEFRRGFGKARIEERKVELEKGLEPVSGCAEGPVLEEAEMKSGGSQEKWESLRRSRSLRGSPVCLLF